MKTQITIGLALVLAVIVGGVSLGCIDKEVTVAPIPTIAPIATPTPTPEVVTVVVVIETVTEITESEVEVITYKEYPVIEYKECYVEYPDNVAGFDTPKERAYIYQSMLDKKMDSLYAEGITQQRYQQRGDLSYTEFYYTLYQDKQDSYQKLYCGLGNRILTDDNDPIIRTIAAFNFTSPWGPRNLGNGSFEYNTYQGTVSFVGADEIASGGAVTVNASGATINNMYYTYMGNNATLPGETEITF